MAFASKQNVLELTTLKYMQIRTLLQKIFNPIVNLKDVPLLTFLVTIRQSSRFPHYIAIWIDAISHCQDTF